MRADAADIDCRSQSRAVVGDKHIGHYGCQILDGVHLCVLHVLLRKQGDGGGLLAQFPVFFGGGDDGYFLYIHHFQGVCLFGKYVAGCQEAEDTGQNSISIHKLVF